ncbi:MAG: metallophosphoesterase [Chthoniobacterales bacterium]
MKRLFRVTLSLLLLAGASDLGARNDTSASVGPATILPEGPGSGEDFRFVALGDTGTGGEAQRAIANRMLAFQEQHPYNEVLLLGDNAYPHGEPSDLAAKFEQPFAELLRRGVRFNAVLGNHDVEHGRTAQLNYPPFHMGGRAYYSFAKGSGLVEFFALDSNNMEPEQLRWLEKALAASKAKWKIAFLHHPLYSTAKRHGSDVALRALLEPLFIRYEVAAVFCGHDHVYERTKLQQGVQYFVTGAGAKLRRGDIDRRSTLLATGNDETNSFMYLQVTPGQLAFWAVDADGHILDGGTLADGATNRSGSVSTGETRP